MSLVSELTEEIRQFAVERDWEQFHSPRNLLLALCGEAGELAAELQWVAEDRVNEHLSESNGRERFEAEVADVAIYLLRLCDVTQVDLGAAIRRKLVKNALKYPSEKVRGSAARYSSADPES